MRRARGGILAPFMKERPGDDTSPCPATDVVDITHPEAILFTPRIFPTVVFVLGRLFLSAERGPVLPAVEGLHEVGALDGATQCRRGC